MSDNSNPDDGAGSFGADSLTETTSRSWFDRIKGALIGVLVGLLLLVGGVWLLAWNEGRAVHTARSLAEGSRLVLDVPAEAVAPANEGKLVHVSAPLVLRGSLADAEFGLRVEGAVQLRRHVEMFQWREEQHSETRSKLGGGQETVTTYSYSRGWADTQQDSSRFRQPGGHANPPMRFRSQVEVAREAQLGGFRLDQGLLQQLGEFQPLPANAVPARAGAQRMEAGLYLGEDPGAPRLGDMRVTWSVARVAAASVVGQQVGNGFRPYQTRAGDALLLVANGQVSASAMIHQAEEENALLSWILRGVGTVLIFISGLMLLRPIVVLADIVPIFGSIMGFGTGLVALLLTVVVAPLTIALAWLWFRPLVGVAVLLLGGGLIYGVGRLMRRHHQPVAPAGNWAPVPQQAPQGGQRSSFFPPGWQPPPR